MKETKTVKFSDIKDYPELSVLFADINSKHRR